MLVTPMGLTVIACLINKGILCQLSVHISVHTWVWTQSAGGCSLCLTARSMDLFSLSSLWLEHMVNPPTVGTPGIKKSTLMERKKSFICGKNISQLSVLTDFLDCPWTAKIGFSEMEYYRCKSTFYILTSVCKFSTLISYTFPDILTRRICFTINSFFSLWPWCLIQGWHCQEEIDAYHSQREKD